MYDVAINYPYFLRKSKKTPNENKTALGALHKQQNENERLAQKTTSKTSWLFQVHAAPATPAPKAVTFDPTVPNTDSGKNAVHQHGEMTIQQLPSTVKKPPAVAGRKKSSPLISALSTKSGKPSRQGCKEVQ